MQPPDGSYEWEDNERMTGMRDGFSASTISSLADFNSLCIFMDILIDASDSERGRSRRESVRQDYTFLKPLLLSSPHFWLSKLHPLSRKRTPRFYESVTMRGTQQLLNESENVSLYDIMTRLLS